MTVGNCSVCGVHLKTPYGAWSHAKRHIREADSILGRETEDYEEVRKVLKGRLDAVEGPQTTIHGALRDSDQLSLMEAL